jgi:hypothetical protein
MVQDHKGKQLLFCFSANLTIFLVQLKSCYEESRIEHVNFVDNIVWQQDKNGLKAWLSEIGGNRGPNLKSFQDAEIDFLDDNFLELHPRVCYARNLLILRGHIFHIFVALVMSKILFERLLIITFRHIARSTPFFRFLSFVASLWSLLNRY